VPPLPVVSNSNSSLLEPVPNSLLNKAGMVPSFVQICCRVCSFV